MGATPAQTRAGAPVERRVPAVSGVRDGPAAAVVRVLLGLIHQGDGEVVHGDLTARGLVGALDIAAGARLARYFGTTPQFWLNLQTTYELDMVEDLKGEQIAAIQPLEVA
ncbi:MAG: transcriptional regulator [Rothia dentocariosa]